MARYPFSLYKRYSANSSRFSYYVQYWNPSTSSYLSGRSIERLRELLQMDPSKYSATKKSDSRTIALAWIEKHGIAPAISESRLGSYCLAFWDWDKSEYIRGLKLRGRKIGKEYVGNNYSYIKHYLVPKPLAKRPLSEVTPADIESLILEIKENTGLSNTSCNAILCALGKPLSEAQRLGLIKENPLQRVPKLQKDNVVKGILSSNEIRDLFSTQWNDNRARVAAMVSLSCGLRLGEVQALKKDSILGDRIVVAGSYSKQEGLKTTKNGKVRIVPLPETIKAALTELASCNPHNESWIFWSEKAGIPMHGKTIEKAFYAQLAKIGIKDSAPKQLPEPNSRQARHLSFHSLRHLYNTLLRGAIPDELLRETTGHLTASMTDHYDHPEHDARLKETADAVGERILPLILGDPRHAEAGK